MSPPAVFASPKGLATALTVLLIICAAASLYMAVAAGNMTSLLNDFENGKVISRSRAENADDMWDSARAIYSVVFLPTAIVVLVWFHRVRVNAEVFAPAGHRLSRGWSIGAWFVPVVNLWFPKQIANDIWRASTPYGANPGLGAVTAWWTLWIISWVLNVLSFPADENDLDDMQREASMTTAAGLAMVAASILALLFIRKLSDRQLAKWYQGPNPQGAAPYAPGVPGAY
jgi:hypothetical protein